MRAADYRRIEAFARKDADGLTLKEIAEGRVVERSKLECRGWVEDCC